jgi:hypothetical protein
LSVVKLGGTREVRFFVWLFVYLSQYRTYTVGLMTEEWDLIFTRGRDFLFIMLRLSLGVEADHSPLHSADVRNTWGYISM